MNSLLKTSLVSIGSAIIGGVFVFTAIKFSPSFNEPTQISKPTPVFNDFFAYDPFTEMRKMQSQFENLGNDIGLRNDITTREDDEFVYIEVNVDDPKSTSIKTEVEDGFITIIGTTEKNESDSVFKSTFNRTFPLPEEIDESKMQMLPEDDKIILKFPKTKA